MEVDLKFRWGCLENCLGFIGLYYLSYLRLTGLEKVVISILTFVKNLLSLSHFEQLLIE